MFKKSLLAVALAFASSGAFAAAETYVMDNHHTQVEFSWNHFGFSNPVANFDNIEGSINYDADDITKSSVEVTIATSSINSHVKDFNEHLASADFFDVAKYPSSTFKSTSVKKGAADNKLLVSGDLTIHGVTKPVTIDATLNRAAPHPMSKQPTVGFDGVLFIKRSDFGIGKYVPNVSDEVRIRITTEASVAKQTGS
ncbi:MAG: polyisoprenoid-binding protein [Dokdonella sp.]|jgi:polyisoprenoid-binding protein YceI|uniref:YceI family protein n=1 Tax=Dokdonella sp. TaxID=2291710 RepID=UPI0025BEB62E|nr:YceI family protein [Dokdonella sp.]MBK8123400.1 polyisoprenoid-binding protein [Dokdonella sp.]HNV09392.1 YceI family protein [Dokdonella sp.]HPW04139.1 YceI family protein [Dokdonella sp.]